MLSRTKYKTDRQTIAALFEAAGLGEAGEIAPLGAGQYNAVYAAQAGGRDYVIKIAPDDSIPVLTYEQDMMASEVYWYKQLREHTAVRVPEIYGEDFTRQRIPTSYFIMEKLPGSTLAKMKLSKEEKRQAAAALAHMTAQFHRVKGERYGYRQNGLHDTWYEAIRSMTQALLDDCARVGKRSRRGERLLGYIDQYREVLCQAECRMVNFDLWNLNVICSRGEQGIRYALIDPERTFWGDPIADFVCQDTFTPFAKRKALLEAYNQAAESPVTLTREIEIRYAVAHAYLGLIMETEKYYRYSLRHLGWWMNIAACVGIYGWAFGVLGHG